jgi:putative hydrolase of the HAD superfamily
MDGMFDAVAFDIDGTVYPNYRFYWRLLPFLLRETPLLVAFGKARHGLREEQAARELAARDSGGHALNVQFPPEGAPPYSGEFYRLQAARMARFLKQDEAVVREWTERRIYRAWEPLFARVRLFPGVRETIGAFRQRGIKTAVLSDFPLGRKLDNLGLGGLWDAALCSEEAGCLKPAAPVFEELRRRLDVPAARILYVGNSVRYDIFGAKRAGMRSALISANPFVNARLRNARARKAGMPDAGTAPDFIFSAYRQLRAFVLG